MSMSVSYDYDLARLAHEFGCLYTCHEDTQTKLWETEAGHRATVKFVASRRATDLRIDPVVERYSEEATLQKYDDIPKQALWLPLFSSAQVLNSY
jgi:hypothetical protein